ncbi:MAG: glycosyltransferase family 39 protein, partial [Nanoarchaeota archaeon]
LAAAFLIRVGFEEFALKFLLVIIPATLLVYFTYLLGKELFDKKTGLFAALASAGMWSYLFWGARFQPDFLSLTFQVLSLLFFWKMFKEPTTKNAIWGGVFAALGFYFKISALLIPLSVGIFALWKDRLEMFKKKVYWQALFAFIITMIPFMLWQYTLFGNPTAFAPSYGVEGGTAERPLGWMALDFFINFPKELFFFLFLIGIITALLRIGLQFDLMVKNKEKRVNAQIFSIMIIAIVACFYIFYIQGVIEDRWVFLITPFIFYFAAQGIWSIFSWLKINSKGIKLFIILILFIVFFYVQSTHTTELVKNKLQSYVPVKEAALWIKDHSSPYDKVVSASYTQMTAYAEREVLIFAPCTYGCNQFENDRVFDGYLKEKRPRYITFSLFEGHPPWAFQQRQYENGVQEIILPYLNSSLAFNQQGQVVGMDIKQSVQREDLIFTLVYPTSGVNGVFVYEVIYEKNLSPQSL